MQKLNQYKIYLFYLFLFLIPFNLRIIFNFDRINNLEGFREHITHSFYAFDLIFILLLLVVLLDWLQNKRPKTSTSKKIFTNPLFYFVITTVITSVLALNQTVAFQQTLRIAQAVVFFLIANSILSSSPSWGKSGELRMSNSRGVKKPGWDSKPFYISILIIFLSGTLQSLIALCQFIFQKSVGLKILGESVIAPEILGVAKFEILGEKLIRAYGTFPHPNLLAAFLLLSLACGAFLLIYKKSSPFYKKKYKYVSDLLSKNYFYTIGTVMILFGVCLTYSRSVILATVVFIILLWIGHRKKVGDVYRGWCKQLRIHSIFQTALAVLAIFAVTFLLYNIFAPRLCFSNCFNDNSIELRGRYSAAAAEIIVQNPLTGVGPGNFVIALADSSVGATLQPWEFQPVHNLYLLIASEIGLVGLVFLLIFVSTLIYAYMRVKLGRTLNLQSLVGNPFFILLLAFLFLGLIDHYFWTLPQGLLIFWLSLAFFDMSSKIKVEPKQRRSHALRTEIY